MNWRWYNYNRLIILLHLILLYCSENSFCKGDKDKLQPRSYTRVELAMADLRNPLEEAQQDLLVNWL